MKFPNIPEGYALVHKDALRAWGKLEEVEAVCHYPVAPELAKMREDNVWHNFRQVGPILKLAAERHWSWFANPKCKYIGLRIDMRDFGCIITDRDGNRITPDQLAFQQRS